MFSEYHEILPCGGMLIVDSDDWFIQYDIPTLNPRAGSVLINIKSNEIDDHITALKANLEIFKDFKKNSGSRIFGIPGAMNMTINLHGHAKGVCLNNYYRAVYDDDSFERIKNSYNYAKIKAAQILNSKSTH